MAQFLLWYLSISIIGWLTLPLAFRLMSGLFDRGYAFQRTFGWLLWGYIFWVLASLGVFPNDLGGEITALIILAALSGWAYWGIDRVQLAAWWRTHRRYVLCVEVLFLLAFAGWTIVRAANPEIRYTEKPMELAFINAILRSPEFPPHDPWLSGYAISYYYLGYVLVAMLARLTGTSAGVAFNLALSLVFALSAIGAYGVVYNLLRREPGDRRFALRGAFLGPFFLLILSNLEGALDLMHARGWFWQKDEAGNLVSRFWTWLDMKELSQPPPVPFPMVPQRNWWWWRASRVIQDYDFAGQWREVIDEFPFFSYLLGDLHPHVLAMPLGLLMIGLAIHYYRRGFRGAFRWQGIHLPLGAGEILFLAVVLGSLFALNTWDVPVYLLLIVAAGVLHRSERLGWEWARLRELFSIALAVGLAGILLYLPFFIGFSSQAGGILPNLLNPTRGAHLWVMFGTLLVPLFLYLMKSIAHTKAGTARPALLITLGSLLSLWLFSLALGWVIAKLPVVRELALDLLGAGDAGVAAVFQEALRRRAEIFAGWLTLGSLLFLGLWAFWPRFGSSADERESSSLGASPPVLLLVVLGTLLVLLPEFVYLRDQFGTRMNTVFKFYYLAWILWSCAAAYSSVVLIRTARGFWGWLARLGLTLVLAAGLVYPVLGLWTKTNGFRPPQGWRLDGTLHSDYLSADDRAAVEWLASAPLGVVAEAIGGSYTGYARIATHTGLPTVLGWPGHEVQWRGGAKEMGSRQSDVQMLYTTRDWETAWKIIQQYDIKYIYLGYLERQTYRVDEAKFQQHLPLAFQAGQVKIYLVP
jgi:YYY domain-containing protein